MKPAKIFLAAFLALGMTVPGRAETVDKIAAVVNDQIITSHQLDQAVDTYLKAQGGGRPLSAVESARLRSQVLDRQIEDGLVAQKIVKLGLKVSDDEVENAIRDVQKQNKLTREQLIAALQAQGMDFDVYKENLRQQILRFRLVGKEVQSKVEVTGQEVRDYFKEHIDDYREAPFMRISQLTFKLPKGAGEKQRAALKAKAEAARKLLVSGEELPAVLHAYADNGVEGGDMGVFKEGELNPVFDQAIRNLQEKEVSEVVEGPDGAYYLFKVDVRKPGSIRQFDVVKGEIEQTLLEQNREKKFKEWAQGLKKDAYIDIRI